MRTKQKSAFADRKMLGRAIKDSFVKLSPKTQAKNPVMFLVFVSAILTSILWVVSLFGLKDAPSGYTLAIAIILWFTVLFANFAEAIAEGRGKAQADSLRASRKDVDAHKIPSVSQKDSVTVVPSALLKKGELVIVKAGEQIPADGEVIEGAASVDESAITGESAPVIREAGGDRSAVTGGTSVLSDWIVVRVTNEAGESFLDKMIAMVEGAARKKTPNEIALQIFLVALSIIFILVTVSLYTYSIFSAKLAGIENPTSVTTLVPMFIAIMGFIFWMTFSVLGKWLSDLLALGIDEVTALVDNALTAYGLNPVVHSLVIDGVFAGVGSMLSFLPIIVVLFFFLAILEDTGYMSRVAFVMDKLLRRIGLSGRSFVPMLIGFGCSVPAIMATRTLSSERDRKMTMLLIPFMSCSAKIPIYAVFTAAFFPDHGGLVMTCLYVFGMLVGIIAAKVLSKTAFTGKPVPFVMELPNYRMPSLKSVLLLMWEKAWDFIRRAFTVIFAATIVIWFLQHFDVRLNVVGEGSTDSLLAIIGTWIAPVFAPLGFGDWRVATALLTGLMAKEAVISTLGVLMNVGANLGSAALGGLFTLPSAVSFLVFCLLYTPCVAALAALRRELGSGVKTVLVMISQCCVAWLAAFCVYALIGVIF